MAAKITIDLCDIFLLDDGEEKMHYSVSLVADGHSFQLQGRDKKGKLKIIQITKCHSKPEGFKQEGHWARMRKGEHFA